MTTDDLIRESLRKQADLAPPPHAVLAALHRPRRRRRPLLLVVTVVVSVLAVVVLAVNRVTTEPAPPVTTTPSFYQPMWLPDGFTEQVRTMSGAAYHRVWRNSGQEVSFAVSPDQAGQLDRTGDRVDLGRFGEGFYSLKVDPALDTALSWAEDGNLISVYVRGLPDGREVARRFVMSLTSNGRTRPADVLSPPQRVLDRAGFVVQEWRGTSATDWTVEFQYENVAGSTVMRLTAVRPDTIDGQPVRARGVDATYVPPRFHDGSTSEPLLVVPVGNAFLTIAGWPGHYRSAHPPDTLLVELISIADTTAVRSPDLSWLGTR